MKRRATYRSPPRLRGREREGEAPRSELAARAPSPALPRKRGRETAVFALAFVLAISSAGPAAQAADKVSFGQVSPTATVWPGTVATQKGFFAANNVEMDTVSIGVSPGMQAVAAGSLDIMHNTCNAPITFYEGGGANVRISMVSMSTHPAVLIGKKGVTNIAELKGKVIGTSSIKSGSTVLLRRLLRAHGLGNKDYDLVAGQGSAQIFNGLQAGALDAVWLVPPQSYTASSAGYAVLGTFREVAPNFPFVCFVTNTQWLKTKADVGRRFVKAWLAAVRWLHDPDNRAEAERLLAAELKVSADAAAKTYDDLIVRNPDTFPRNGRLDSDTLRAMLTVMVEGEELNAMPQGDMRKYLDDTLLAE
jgi:ABC-type nitrate/sulfonate/bicarbonate transport system substrate-binding protein